MTYITCRVCGGANGTLVKDDKGYRHQDNNICQQFRAIQPPARRASPLVVARPRIYLPNEGVKPCLPLLI